MSTHPIQRTGRSPVRIFIFTITLAALLLAASFLVWLYRASAEQQDDIESTARANQTAVWRAAQGSDAQAILRLDASGTPMALVPAGPFAMGSQDGDSDELPVRLITLDEYYIDIFEVTNRLYGQCVDAGACRPPLRLSSQRRAQYYSNPPYADYPVIHISYEQATAFCAWREARLPTEAEWEKAARGGLEGMQYPWGNEAPVCTPGAINGANFDRCSPADTWPVGSFAPNGYGLYDMAGNVWEWVADWYDIGYNPGAPSTNPTGPEIGTARVLRGGAWNLIDWYLRVANRLKNYPVDSGPNIGFRCVQSP